jgi:hypothetical protein
MINTMDKLTIKTPKQNVVQKYRKPRHQLKTAGNPISSRKVEDTPLAIEKYRKPSQQEKRTGYYALEKKYRKHH